MPKLRFELKSRDISFSTLELSQADATTAIFKTQQHNIGKGQVHARIMNVWWCVNLLLLMLTF
jgi:hypothetical protein